MNRRLPAEACANHSEAVAWRNALTGCEQTKRQRAESTLAEISCTAESSCSASQV